MLQHCSSGTPRVYIVSGHNQHHESISRSDNIWSCRNLWCRRIPPAGVDWAWACSLLFYNMTLIISATGKCSFTVDTTAPDDAASWYDLWQAAVALDGMCARTGRAGKSRFLGEYAVVWFEWGAYRSLRHRSEASYGDEEVGTAWSKSSSAKGGAGLNCLWLKFMHRWSVVRRTDYGCFDYANVYANQIILHH